MAVRPSHVKMTAQRDRHDFGALEQRVYGAERKIDELGVQTSSQIQNLRTELGSAIQLISTKIDQQQTAQIDSSRTKWTPIVTCATGLAVAFVAIFGVVGSMALTPIRTDIEKLYKAVDETNNKMTPLLTLADDQKSNVIQFAALTKADEGKWSRDAQAEYEKRVDERYKLEHEYAVRDLARVEGHINEVDSNQIKRPEIQAADSNIRDRITASEATQNDRTNSLSARANATDAKVDALFPPSKMVDQIWEQLRESRMNAAPVAPIAPLAPLAPILPVPSK